MTFNYEALIKKKFLQLCTDFLYFEILRSLECVKIFKSPNTYIIMQIILWNQQLSKLKESEYQKREIIRNKCFDDSKFGNKDNVKLSYTLVSELFGLSIETVKRHVKMIIKQNWVQYSKKGKVKFIANKDTCIHF